MAATYYGRNDRVNVNLASKLPNSLMLIAPEDLTIKVVTEGGQFGTFRGITGLNLLQSKKDRRNQSLFFAGEASFTKGFFESLKDLKPKIKQNTYLLTNYKSKLQVNKTVHIYVYL